MQGRFPLVAPLLVHIVLASFRREKMFSHGEVGTSMLQTSNRYLFGVVCQTLVVVYFERLQTRRDFTYTTTYIMAVFRWRDREVFVPSSFSTSPTFKMFKKPAPEPLGGNLKNEPKKGIIASWGLRVVESWKKLKPGRLLRRTTRSPALLNRTGPRSNSVPLVFPSSAAALREQKTVQSTRGFFSDVKETSYVFWVYHFLISRLTSCGSREKRWSSFGSLGKHHKASHETSLTLWSKTITFWSGGRFGKTALVRTRMDIFPFFFPNCCEDNSCTHTFQSLWFWICFLVFLKTKLVYGFCGMFGWFCERIAAILAGFGIVSVFESFVRLALVAQLFFRKSASDDVKAAQHSSTSHFFGGLCENFPAVDWWVIEIVKRNFTKKWDQNQKKQQRKRKHRWQKMRDKNQRSHTKMDWNWNQTTKPQKMQVKSNTKTPK